MRSVAAIGLSTYYGYFNDRPWSASWLIGLVECRLFALGRWR